MNFHQANQKSIFENPAQQISRNLSNANVQGESFTQQTKTNNYRFNLKNLSGGLEDLNSNIEYLRQRQKQQRKDKSHKSIDHSLAEDPKEMTSAYCNNYAPKNTADHRNYFSNLQMHENNYSSDQINPDLVNSDNRRIPTIKPAEAPSYELKRRHNQPTLQQKGVFKSQYLFKDDKRNRSSDRD